nr:hypothetical protein Iba_chr15dCG8370 [Ipomoea batatas]
MPIRSLVELRTWLDSSHALMQRVPYVPLRKSPWSSDPGFFLLHDHYDWQSGYLGPWARKRMVEFPKILVLEGCQSCAVELQDLAVVNSGLIIDVAVSKFPVREL